MKEIKFRPLRRVRKTDKIVVASYSSWYKVACANGREFVLKVDPSYHQLPEDEFVYKSNGEQLFFFDILPEVIPVFLYPFDIDYILANYKVYGLRWDKHLPINYNCPGLDCGGTPTFTHYTANYIASHYKLERMNEFQPLTVGMVKKIFGWFLYNLENATVTI